MTEKRSAVGTYAGYTEVCANGYVRRSEYVTVRDGTRIAIDCLHPALDGKPLPGPRPTVVRGTGYRRSFVKGQSSFYDVGRLKILEKYPVGTLITPYELAPNATVLVDHGYNFVSVDFRGTGASFGQNTSVENGRDLADVIDWIATQDWSDGKIGTWGRSWEAWVQMQCAAAQPRNLSCMMPMALTNGRDALWYNGVFLDGFLKGWSLLRQGQDNQEPASPVAGPDGEKLRDEARAQAEGRYLHSDVGKTSAPITEWLDEAQAATRQIYPQLVGSPAGELNSTFDNIERINACGAAIYIVGGWWDMTFVNDQLGLYRSLTVPKKILEGPWTHSQFEFGHEPLRWFDYWLKGIDNGIMDEAPIHYCTSKVDGSKQWRGAADWPLAPTTSRKLFATPDGALTDTAPASTTLDHSVDHQINNGLASRTPYMFHSLYLNYRHLAERAERALAFTSEPLSEDTDITGVPSVTLRLACDQEDLALMITLEQIDEQGQPHYLTEGLLNLKHRKLSEPGFKAVEPHFHSENKADALPVTPGEPMEVELDLFALSCRIEKGHRLRVVLAFADTENYAMPTYDPPAQVQLELGPGPGLCIALPVMPAAETPVPVANAFADDVADYAFELPARN